LKGVVDGSVTQKLRREIEDYKKRIEEMTRSFEVERRGSNSLISVLHKQIEQTKSERDEFERLMGNQNVVIQMVSMEEPNGDKSFKSGDNLENINLQDSFDELISQLNTLNLGMTTKQIENFALKYHDVVLKYSKDLFAKNRR